MLYDIVLTAFIVHAHQMLSFQVLTVEVMDKDEGSVLDDYVGSFTTTLISGAKEVEIVSTIRKAVRGTFWLNVSGLTASPLLLITDCVPFPLHIRAHRTTYALHFAFGTQD